MNLLRSSFLFAGLASAFLFALHCGSDDDSTFGESPCTTTLKAECGKACTQDTDCASGTHCESKVCTAACAAGGKCADGQTCSPRGRCGADPGSTTIIGDNVDSGNLPESDSCADIDVTLSKTKPTVLLLVDRSGSMKDAQFPPGSGVSRWDAVRNALIDPDGGVIESLQSEVSFGLATYSWSGNGGDHCPQITSVAAALNNYQPIHDIYAPLATQNNTPTAESIMTVVGLNDAGTTTGDGFAAIDAGGPKILVLATDGDPDLCTNGGANGTQPPKDFTIWATQRTFDTGITTYVISVGTDSDAKFQQQVANVGQGKQLDGGALTTVFRPNNSAEVVTQLRSIINGVRTCTFKLNGAVVAGTESQGTVTLNGAPLGYNDPNGWKLNSPTELEVTGTSCDTVKNSESAQISVRFPCNAFTDGVR